MDRHCGVWFVKQTNDKMRHIASAVFVRNYDLFVSTHRTIRSHDFRWATIDLPVVISSIRQYRVHCTRPLHTIFVQYTRVNFMSIYYLAMRSFYSIELAFFFRKNWTKLSGLTRQSTHSNRQLIVFFLKFHEERVINLKCEHMKRI